jgi:broad specificity phosphatase PhoE
VKLILIRHGHVPGIDPPRFRGQHEVPLTDRGVEQARLTGAAVAERWSVDAIYTSPLGRCVTTGAAIAAATGAPAMVMPDLANFDYGEWAWRTHEEVRAETPGLYALWLSQPWRVQIPSGDSLQTLVARAADAMRAMAAAHPAGTVVAVAHDTTNRAILMQCLGMPLDSYWRIDQSPCCINEIDLGVEVRVRMVNATDHLPRGDADTKKEMSK